VTRLDEMADIAASFAIQIAGALVQQLRSMAEVDEASKKLLSIVENICYALDDAQRRGAFRSATDSTMGNIARLRQLLEELQAWVNNYNHAGKTKGMLARMRDYFCAGKDLDKLSSLGEELDRAFKSLHLSLNLEICAVVKDLVVQQSGVAREVFQMIQQHSGTPNDSKLAEAIARKTNIAIENVRHELASSMECLRRVDDKLAHIRDRVDALTRLLEANMGLENFTAPLNGIEHNLEYAPFGVSEWVEKRQGM